MNQRMIRTILVLCLATLSAAALRAQPSLEEQYRAVAGRLIGAAMVDQDGWEKLTYLCDRIGHRLSGSQSLEFAVDWATEQMRNDGLENVRQQPVQVPHWVRGRESLWLLSPRRLQLPVLGLGMSVGTPPEGITAPVVVVSSFEELKQLGREVVAGKVVLYDIPWAGYRNTVRYRSSGASRAAELGAVAALIRSIGPVSLQTPHTGSLRYREEIPKIPAAALSIEGASLIHRLIQAGNPVEVQLKMEAKLLGQAPSANVIGEIPGSERPEEIVVMGGHLDSWDVGQGAHDDGAGCIAAWQAAALIKRLGLQPRRTIRVVLWTNEENGLTGARAYREWVGEAVSQHVAAIEMDGGSERPRGFGLGVAGTEEEQQRALELARQIGRLLDGIGAGEMVAGGGGADISPLMREGVPGFGLRTVGEHYFDWHHTEADTLDKISPQDFRLNVAALAVLAYVLADQPDRLVPAKPAP